MPKKPIYSSEDEDDDEIFGISKESSEEEWQAIQGCTPQRIKIRRKSEKEEQDVKRVGVKRSSVVAPQPKRKKVSQAQESSQPLVKPEHEIDTETQSEITEVEINVEKQKLLSQNLMSQSSRGEEASQNNPLEVKEKVETIPEETPLQKFMRSQQEQRDELIQQQQQALEDFLRSQGQAQQQQLGQEDATNDHSSLFVELRLFELFCE